MPENAIIPDEEAVPETAKEKFERERLSRRQALKKFGMTSAMATFALFSVDDLARMVGKAMQQRAADNKVVEQVAKELQQAGAVFADPGTTCYDCCTHACNSAGLCDSRFCDCEGANDGTNCTAIRDKCYNDALYDYNGCKAVHCYAGETNKCQPCYTTPCAPLMSS